MLWSRDSGTMVHVRASMPQGSKDSSIAGGSVWTERDTILDNKAV